MILILSHESIDEPTNILIDWLSYYNANFIRLNGDDFSFTGTLKIDINNNKIQSNNGQTIVSEDINVVWYRRWMKPEFEKSFFEKYLKMNYSVDDVLLVEKYNKFLLRELSTYTNGIFSIFRKKLWIPKPDKARGNINKLDVLLKAKDIGLIIPETIVTSSKAEVIDFIKINKRIITKPIYEATAIRYKNTEIPMLTMEVTHKDIDEFPDIFFPSLFQKNIDKQFEIRTFIYRNEIYSMAMFSQNDKQTSIDFRNYNIEKPNRYVPFLLPRDIELKLLELLQELDLNTGSVDMIYDNNENYIFLEVNPVGQSAMVSTNCNYPFEKMIAKDLIELDNKDLLI
ncbi:grasp-with-spasm system ATP-grasp peptide maturase [Flavobacterium sp.]|uniref:grasp-with-spasm system ATP-grasp peptide maturase n=1 Tax=Flavobacterium sp. TaxID=239 RepID=UPI00286DE92B|nr:grasp-with-spasm system ATP-grasp peptide maturase [Flavobacterium sp.]